MPTTVVATTDTWTPPAVTGGPSTANFCRVLVAVYTHEQTLTVVADPRMRQDIVADYVRAAPRAIALAPPSIAPAANLYLGAIASVLASLDNAGLDPTKLSNRELTSILLNPRVKDAGNKVIDFSQQECHYTIGG